MRVETIQFCVTSLLVFSKIRTYLNLHGLNMFFFFNKIDDSCDNIFSYCLILVM